jgi:hypothetical protein
MEYLKKGIEYIFPELKESEDEKMLREIKRYIKEQGNKPTGLPNGTVAVADMLAWLEKQGEQKSVWSEEDEAKLKSILFHIEDVENKDVIDWLKHLKDRVQPQRESGERNKLLEKLEEWLDEYVSDLAGVDTASLICSFTNYLDGKLPKSLRPCSHWKPSKEQVMAIDTAINVLGKGTLSGKQLIELQEDLKKLKG